MDILILLFIFAVLHLVTLLLSREVARSEGVNGVISYLGSVVIMGFNVTKFLIFFFIIYRVIILIGI
jgi:hypothetical protein